MALAIGVKLGGDTSYFGKVKKKAIFGCGKKEIESREIKKALSFTFRFDILLTLGAILWTINTVVT